MPPKKQEVKNDRLDDLITKLDDRLNLLCPNKMKEKVLEVLKELEGHVEEISSLSSKLQDIFGVNYGEIHYH